MDISNYKYLVTCYSIDELRSLESMLFSLEFETPQCIPPFYIVVDGTKYKYSLKEFNGKYYISAE